MDTLIGSAVLSRTFAEIISEKYDHHPLEYKEKFYINLNRYEQVHELLLQSTRDTNV